MNFLKYHVLLFKKLKMLVTCKNAGGLKCSYIIVCTFVKSAFILHFFNTKTDET